MRFVRSACLCLAASLGIFSIAVPRGHGQTITAQEEIDSAFEELEDLDLSALLDINITVVSATKLATSLNEVPSIVTVVTQRDIRRWGYRTVAEVLERTLGFYVVDDHITPNVAVRGVTGGLRAESSIIKVMIDGHPVAYRPTSGNWLGAELVPLGAIQQIEIIRGPASALYGADAFMGVVNIITRKDKEASGVDVRLAGNSVNENLGGGVDVSVGQRFDDFEVFAAARYLQEDRAGLTLPTTSPGPNVPNAAPDQADVLGQQSASAFLRLTYNISDRSSVWVGGYFSLQDRDAAFAEWAQLTGTGDEPGTRVNRYNSAVFGQATIAVSDEVTLTLDTTVFFGADTNESRIDVASPDLFVRQKQDFVGTDLQLGTVWKPSERLSFVVGAGLIIDDETLGQTSLILKQGDTTPRDTDPGVEQTFINPGLFAQGNWEAVEQYLTLTGGVRYDYHNIYGSQVSGRFGAVSNPVEDVYVKALYGSAFKAPSPVLQFGRPAQTGDIIGNPDLEPQYVHTVEGQLIYQPSPFFSIGSNLAYSFVRNLAVFSRSGFNNVARNVAELATLSWESYVRASYKNYFGGYVRYEMLFSERNAGDEGFQSALLGDEAGVFPDLQARAGLWAEIAPAYLRATFEARYIGDRRASDLNVLENNGVYTLDPYVLIDATIGTIGLEWFGEERETVLEFIGRNLLDSDGIFPGEAGVDYPIAPRTFLVQLRQTL